MLRASIAAANPPEAVQSVPRNPRDRKAPRLGVTASDSTFRTISMPSSRNKPAHEIKSLVEQAGDWQEGNNGGKEDQCRKQSHHKVIGERRRHLQCVIAFHVSICPNQSRSEFPELHGPLMLFRGLQALWAFCKPTIPSSPHFSSNTHTKRGPPSSSKQSTNSVGRYCRWASGLGFNAARTGMKDNPGSCETDIFNLNQYVCSAAAVERRLADPATSAEAQTQVPATAPQVRGSLALL